jgi:CMP-N-acetylneuraminic acid synthetase
MEVLCLIFAKNNSQRLNLKKNKKIKNKTLLEYSISQLKRLEKIILLRQENDKDIINKISKFNLKILTLPLYPNMINKGKNYLIDSISKFFETCEEK